MKNLKSIGYKLGVIATIVVLVWIGLLKFTPSEAAAIKGYASNSFLMNWLYSLASDQGVSNFIGIFELITAALLIVSFWNDKAGRIGGYLSAVIFLTTLSFLATTPVIWKQMDGIPVTDFFVVKDLAFLAVSLQVLGNHQPL
ncbi:DUF417 family protein [Pedobacter ginsengisoli]|uniref:DUF417 family protein n=1 Tax=Pedobacter ginsengisoli TaxID=363852 RepID=UPI00254A3829|nr:DUF417 family protein [Pedobacter ginsengisoli]